MCYECARQKEQLILFMCYFYFFNATPINTAISVGIFCLLIIYWHFPSSCGVVVFLWYFNYHMAGRGSKKEDVANTTWSRGYAGRRPRSAKLF